jgi:hypothetical protein
VIFSLNIIKTPKSSRDRAEKREKEKEKENEKEKLKKSPQIKRKLTF